MSEDHIHLAHLAKRVDELELLVKRLQDVHRDHSLQLDELRLLNPLHAIVPIVEEVVRAVGWVQRVTERP